MNRSATTVLTRNADLRALNTLGLAARAAFLLRIASSDAACIDPALEAMRACGRPDRLVLGGGSNIVFAGDYAGVVLQMACPGRRLVGADDDAWYVEAGAGENWHAFVRWTLAQGWPGLENLSLIPGTVGAAPVQNIGAYGLELAERVHCVETVDLADGTRRTWDADACRFGYRDSVFKHVAGQGQLIVAVTFRLPRQWRPVLQYGEVAQALRDTGIVAEAADAGQISDAIIAIRRRKLPDPALLGNVGSFFKNPLVGADTLDRLSALHPGMPHYRQADGTIKLAAGWLIEQCGWKGRDLGPVGCYERQALVLVNRGGATGADVLRLAAAIQHDVRARFEVALEPEPLVA